MSNSGPSRGQGMPDDRTAARSDTMEDGPDGGSERARVRITATEWLGDNLTRVCYEIRLPDGRPPIAGALSLPFPSSMSWVAAELRMAVWEAVADAGLPRQLGEVIALD